MTRSSGPTPLARALAELVALRGLAQPNGLAQLATAWREVAGEKIAKHTKVTAIKSGIVHISVASSALLGELAAFHKAELLTALKQARSDLRIRDLKFRLRGEST